MLIPNFSHASHARKSSSYSKVVGALSPAPEASEATPDRLVNAVAHIVAAILWQEYNPGLWTALMLFVPLGTLALLKTARVPGGESIHHTTGITVAIGIHAPMVVYARGKAAKS